MAIKGLSANRVMSDLLQTGFKWENKTRTTYELLAFMHVLSVPGKASIDATKASVVALKFLKYNNKKNVQGSSTTTEQKKAVWMKQDLFMMLNKWLFVMLVLQTA